MPAHKRKNRAGRTVWFYMYSEEGSTRKQRNRISKSGFPTKRSAEDAERERRIEEQRKKKLESAGAIVSGPIPRTLSMLLEEFFTQHVEEKLAPKTIERYRQQAAYLDGELLKMPIDEITPLHLNREWNRLLKSGGHHRGTNEARPLSAKTVRNIAGVISSAFSRAEKWNLVKTNPVSRSEPPVPKKHKGIALSSAQQTLLVASANGPWCLSTFLEVAAATGARRGEILALRWSDVQDGRIVIARSLTQTKNVLEFKTTKTKDSVRVVSLPASTSGVLDLHRKRQQEFRGEFGPDYRADLDLIFANPDGTPLKPDSVSASVSAMCRRLKLAKGVSLHTLRHSHGSHLLAAGTPLPVVSERLGHSSIRVTAEFYSHAIRGQDDEAARKWDKFQQQNSPECEGKVQ